MFEKTSGRKWVKIQELTNSGRSDKPELVITDKQRAR